MTSGKGSFLALRKNYTNKQLIFFHLFTKLASQEWFLNHGSLLDTEGFKDTFGATEDTDLIGQVENERWDILKALQVTEAERERIKILLI